MASAACVFIRNFFDRCGHRLSIKASAKNQEKDKNKYTVHGTKLRRCYSGAKKQGELLHAPGSFSLQGCWF
jgi:hypothetical protein